MASYDEKISVSLQKLSSLAMGDLSNLLTKGLPPPWGLISTSVGSGIQAYTCIGNLIGTNNQIAIVVGAPWTDFLNAVALQGYPALRQESLSESIMSDPDGSGDAAHIITKTLAAVNCLSDWACHSTHEKAKALEKLPVSELFAQENAEIVSFNGPLQSLYISMREALWQLVKKSAKLVNPADTELLICGQGVGAAFAQLAAFDFRPDKDKIAVKFKDIRLYTFSAPLNASEKFQALFEGSIPDAWVVNAGTSRVIDFFPTEPIKDANGQALAQLGTITPQPASLPTFDAPWWERSGPYYTDVLNDKTTTANPKDVSTTTADGYDLELSYVLTQLSAAAAQRAQHPQLAPVLPSSWSLVKAFPDDNPWLSVFHRPSPGLYAVVFRSDTTYAEVMNDLAHFSNKIISWLPENVSVHGGAYELYEQIRTDLRNYLATLDLSNNGLVLAGHSIGAMAAMIAALDLNHNTIGGVTAVNAYCYGSPAAAGYGLGAVYPQYGKNVFLVGRLQDAIARVSWNSLLTRYGTSITIGGTTDFDGATSHAINSYIALLDPAVKGNS